MRSVLLTDLEGLEALSGSDESISWLVPSVAHLLPDLIPSVLRVYPSAA